MEAVGGSGGTAGAGGFGGSGGLGSTGGTGGGAGLDPSALGMVPVPKGLKDPVLKDGKWGLAKKGLRRKNWRRS